MDPITATSLPAADLAALFGMALVLGMRHGADADHLAAIDAIARFNAIERPGLARRTGLWFALGHGAVVMAAALAVSSLSAAWQAPAWLEPFGAWISIVTLLALGLVNAASLRRGGTAPVAPRTRLFSRLLASTGRGQVMALGALFAISFDTLGQAALMAVTGTAAWGAAAVALLAGAFIAGMLATDTLNGWWIARLLQRADAAVDRARASRLMAICVTAVSLGTAALGAATRLSPPVAAWAHAHQGQFSLAIVGIVLAGFALGATLTPRRGERLASGA